MRRSALLLMLPLLLCGGFARADGDAGGSPPAQAPASEHDVLTLKDGRRLEGEIVDENDRFISLRSGGVTRAYAKDTIESVARAARDAGSARPDPAAGTAPVPAPEAGAKEKKKNKGQPKDAPLTDAAKTWLNDLIARSADADETVRRSIAAAIGALGPAAAPVVRAAESAAPDGAQKQFLGKLAADIETRRDRKARGEPGMPGEGMGPDGPGTPGPDRGGPRRGLDDMMQRMTSELELRDDQAPKVRGFLEAAMRQRFEIGREARTQGLSAEQVAERVAPLRTELLSQMKSVLDEPQYTLFEEMAGRLFEMQKGPMGPPPARPADPAK